MPSKEPQSTFPSHATAQPSIPNSMDEARLWLAEALANGADAASLPDPVLTRAWAAIAFLGPGLHPDETRALVERYADADALAVGCHVEAVLYGPADDDSGWPVALVPIAREVNRRLDAGLWSETQFYPVDAQVAALRPDARHAA